MKFEHLLIVRKPTPGESVIEADGEVRDILAILINGLRLLAIRPQALGQDLDDFDLQPLDRAGLEFSRVITRGQFVIEDQIEISADGLGLLQSIMLPESMRGSVKRLTIEQPQRGFVTLRAQYESAPQSDQGALNANELHAIESAYIASDQDFLRKVSELHANDMLEALLKIHQPPVLLSAAGFNLN